MRTMQCDTDTMSLVWSLKFEQLFQKGELHLTESVCPRDFLGMNKMLSSINFHNYKF